MSVELLVANESGTVVYQPVVEEDIEWTTQRRSTPGKLTFNVIRDDIIDFSEGSAVRLKVDGNSLFYGFVFKQKRDKSQIITVTAYDQLRYLQNKDTYVYENKTASQFIKMVAEDFELNLGEIEDTSFIIKSRIEENSSLFDMIENALDLELTNKKEMYVLYDDCGALTLKNISSMYVGDNNSGYLMIDEETGENFSYTSSIDDETYNKVKLTYDNESTGYREVYIAKDSANINKWGILQYFDTLSEGENGQSKADALLSLYDSKTRNLKITNALGDTRVRAGSLVLINLNLGDMTVMKFMMVEKCVHKFYLDSHFMDLTLRGGEFVA
ncbi:MAG: phage tail protein [Lachnospiraceae bacterium]|nr:phage tail protein [Lachnospiraceae bacterium]